MDGSFTVPTGAKVSFSLTAKALARLKAGIDRKSFASILTHAHVEAHAGTLRLTGTDLFTTVRVSVPAVVESAGAICLPIGPFADAVKGAGKGVSSLTAAPNFTAAFAGAVRTTIGGMPVTDFPAMREPAGNAVLAMDVGDLRAALARVSASMSCDPTRPHLSAMLVERKGGVLLLVATDGHRLHKVEQPNAGVDFRVVIPAGAIHQIDRLLGSVKGTAELRIGTATREVDEYDGGRRTTVTQTFNDYVWVGVDDNWVGARLVDESQSHFPFYEQVIPTYSDRDVVLATSPFRAALVACSKVASDRTAGIKLDFKGDTVVLSSENPEVGEARSEPIDVVMVGTGIIIGFNSRYLIDALATVTAETVLVRLCGELDPGMVVDGNLIVVVMPMRL